MNNQQQTITINGKNYTRDHYVYRLSVSTLAPGATLSDTVNIEADSSFTVVKMAYMADIAGAGQTDSTRVIPLVRVQLRDTGSGRQLQNEPVDLSSIAGVGELPFVLPVPRIFAPSSTIQADFINYDAANTYANVSLVLIGYKMFQFG